MAAPLKDARRIFGFLLVRAEFQERRPDGIEREDRHGEASPLHLIKENKLLDRPPLLTAMLLRPANPEPSIAAHFLDGLMVERSAAFHFIEFGEKLLGDQLAQIRSELLPERVLFRCIVEIHQGFPIPSMGAVSWTCLPIRCKVERVLSISAKKRKRRGGNIRN